MILTWREVKWELAGASEDVSDRKPEAARTRFGRWERGRMGFAEAERGGKVRT
jgi:hypothetical protein